MLTSYGALGAAILIGVAGQLLLKAGADRSADGILAQFLNPFTIGGLAAYGLGAIFYIVAIKRIPVSIAFPSVALSYVLVAIAAHLLWQEALGWQQFAGIGLIAAGILVLHASA
ncbi:MAG TPA: EamA family transporter [Stellaceae bacterium]|jgi:small multidrug resistance pump|nr:EamA family transporter [Stellaceae bacterium]